MLVHLIWNAWTQPLSFDLPTLADGQIWRRWIDTSLDPPDDIVSWRSAVPIQGTAYRVTDRSTVVLFSELA
jgi:glycogen operon protein